jgi:hypothetical protein
MRAKLLMLQAATTPLVESSILSRSTSKKR